MSKRVFDSNTVRGRRLFDFSSLLALLFGALRGRIIKRQARGSMVDR